MPCLQSIILYNTYMDGVDRGDQLQGYYWCRTKSRNFYKYIFYFLLDVALTNAFISMKHHTANGSKMSIKDFRLQLESQLVEECCSPLVHHLPDPIPKNEQHSTYKPFSCVYDTERDIPSVKTGGERNMDQPKCPKLLVRVLYSECEVALYRTIEGLLYTCGSTLRGV